MGLISHLSKCAPHHTPTPPAHFASALDPLSHSIFLSFPAYPTQMTQFSSSREKKLHTQDPKPLPAPKSLTPKQSQISVTLVQRGSLSHHKPVCHQGQSIHYSKLLSKKLNSICIQQKAVKHHVPCSKVYFKSRHWSQPWKSGGGVPLIMYWGSLPSQFCSHNPEHVIEKQNLQKS